MSAILPTGWNERIFENRRAVPKGTPLTALERISQASQGLGYGLAGISSAALLGHLYRIGVCSISNLVTEGPLLNCGYNFPVSTVINVGLLTATVVMGGKSLLASIRAYEGVQ